MSYLPLPNLGPQFSAEKVAEEATERANDATTPVRSLSSSEPCRSKASPRNSSPSTRSTSPHVSFDLRVNEAETIYLSSGEQSPIRGRTLRRVPARDRTSSRSSILEEWIIRNRLMSRDLTQTPEQYLDDTLLEPRPFDRIRSYSLTEELHRVESIDLPIDFTRYIGHRDTFGTITFGDTDINKRRSKAFELPDTFFTGLVRHIDVQSYKSVRLSCRNWSRGITRAWPVTTPTSMKLPAEVLERVYDHLSPHDFDSARHTCRSWMVASLNQSLLTRKLQQGGWWNALQLDIARLESSSGRRMSMISHNWLLSKRLATECALSSCSNGFTLKDQKSRADRDPSTSSPLKLTSRVDFSELARQQEGVHTGDPALRFDVSVCQKYAMVTKGHLIYVYALQDPYGNPAHEYGGYLHATTIVDCPGQVLAVSMDTSSDRLSIAALLEDRVGMVHEFNSRRRVSITPSSTPTNPSKVHGSRSGSGSVPNADAFNEDYGPQTLYRSVCSAQDPPRTVAICPQRRCVAFGNSTGIEVHWIDALSGQDLQRWFPLSSPSECLFFLPNRVGIDSARKLRIIASSVHGPQSHIEAQQYPNRVEQLNKKGPWDDYSGEDQAWKLNWAFSRMSTSGQEHPSPDHHSARPLSDGNTFLFIDSPSGRLVLGCDENVDQGVPSLSHRFVFVGPSQEMVPFVYSPAIELQWGVRIVAGFADSRSLDSNHEIWLFSVPPDDFYSERTYAADDSDSIQSVPVQSISDVIAIQGIHIANVTSLSTVAIDATDGDLTVRAFSIVDGGSLFTWQLATTNETIRKAVLADGVTIPVITDGQGDDDDVVMEDAQGILTWSREMDFDGAASPTLGHDISLIEQRDDVDDDGDVCMLDAPLIPLPASQPQFSECSTPPSPPSPTSTPPPPAPIFWHDGPSEDEEEEDEGYYSLPDDGEGQEEYHAAGGAFAIHVPPLHGRRWSESHDWVPEYLGAHGMGIEDEGVGVDLVEAARVEVEVVGL